MSSFGQIILNHPDRNPSTTSRTEPQRYLDVLDAFFDLVGSEVVVGDQLVALFDGLLQVTGSPAHLVFEGFVLTQQSQRSRQILPIILGGEDLLLLPDPALLQTTETRSGLTGYIRSGVRRSFHTLPLVCRQVLKGLIIMIEVILIQTSSAISQKNFQRRRDSSRRARRSAASWLSSW